MKNAVTLTGRLIEAPKLRTIESRGGAVEVISLWLETAANERRDRFTVEISCPRVAARAKELKPDTIVDLTGALRHDRWKDKRSGQWTGKVFIAIDPAAGTLRSQGLANAA